MADPSLDPAVAFDPCTVNRETGHFILIDRLNDNAADAGLPASTL